MIYTFSDNKTTQINTMGGKAAILANLFQQGYPVPNGFVISAEAFTEAGLAETAWTAVLVAVNELRRGNGRSAFAVRSSALNEDSAQASFAGEYETVLNTTTDAEIKQAIQTVFDSQFSLRVSAYRQAATTETVSPTPHGAIAVIVQKMVPAELAGVLFTADPLTGSHMHMVGNFVQGLSEQLVSGEANAEQFLLKRPLGTYTGPPILKQFAKKLFKLTTKIEKQLGSPQDIEWAIANGQIFLLQSRPITTMQNYNPVTGIINDSLRGDYIWSNANLGEAFPDVMTPLTWSLLQIYANESNPLSLPGNHPMMGNIGGRFYMNMSLMVSFMQSLGFSRERINKESEEFFGHLPENVVIPLVPFSRWQLLRQNGVRLITIQKKRRKLFADLPAFIANNPAQVDTFNNRIQNAPSAEALASLWQESLNPYFKLACQMMQAGTSRYENAYRSLRQTLQKLVDEAEVITLLSGVSENSQQLASLGPLVGLWQVANGELSAEAYAHQFGHRGPHEMETYHPRPSEDSAWLDAQLANLQGTDVPALLAAQARKREAAWATFSQQFPKEAAKLQPKLAEAAEFARDREAVRSEFTRLFGLMRTYALRAAGLTGLHDDVFFLSIAELVAVLDGATVTAVSEIAARRQGYETCSALPAYPAIINGRFDHIAWAAAPNQRTDVFDAHPNGTQSALPPNENQITGFPGSPGIVEGVVRVLHSLEESHQLQHGEILVTTLTNIGWTPIFPKVTAVVTDVGAPLSHAAIVARELGVPAIVGCGDATIRLQTGDRVRVDGGSGVILKLASGN